MPVAGADPSDGSILERLEIELPRQLGNDANAGAGYEIAGFGRYHRGHMSRVFWRREFSFSADCPRAIHFEFSRRFLEKLSATVVGSNFELVLFTRADQQLTGYQLQLCRLLIVA